MIIIIFIILALQWRIGGHLQKKTESVYKCWINKVGIRITYLYESTRLVFIKVKYVQHYYDWSKLWSITAFADYCCQWLSSELTLRDWMTEWMSLELYTIQFKSNTITYTNNNDKYNINKNNINYTNKNNNNNINNSNKNI